MTIRKSVQWALVFSVLLFFTFFSFRDYSHNHFKTVFAQATERHAAQGTGLIAVIAIESTNINIIQQMVGATGDRTICFVWSPALLGSLGETSALRQNGTIKIAAQPFPFYIVTSSKRTDDLLHTQLKNNWLRCITIPSVRIIPFNPFDVS